MNNLLDPQHALVAAVPEPRAGGARGRRRRRRRGAAVRAPRSDVHAALAGDAGAAGGDHGRSAGARDRDPRAARPGDGSSTTRPSCFTASARVRQARDQASQQLAPADRGRDPRAAPRARSSTTASRDAIDAIERFAEDSQHAARARAADRDRAAARADDRVRDARRRRPATTWRCCSATSRARCRSPTTSAASCASGSCALPQLPNSEAGPSSAPADGPPAPPGAPLTTKTLEDDSFLHSNPYPNTDAPGQTPECEARQRELHQGPPGDRQRPRRPGASHRADQAGAAVRWAERGIGRSRRACWGSSLLAIAAYFIFTKQLPFTNHYTVKAVVHNSNLLVPGSPVRIGGVDVGKVTAIGRYRNTELWRRSRCRSTTRARRSRRRDARGSARGCSSRATSTSTCRRGRRTPGSSPTAARFRSATRSIRCRSTSCSTRCPPDNRRRLQQTLEGFGEAVDTKPSAAEDAHLDPAVRGLTGAQAINKTFDTSAASLRDSAIVSERADRPHRRISSARRLAGSPAPPPGWRAPTAS